MNQYIINDLIAEKITGEWGKEPTLNPTKVLRTTNFTNDGKLNLLNVVERDIDPKIIQKKKLQVGDVIIEKSGGSPTQPVGRVVYFDVNDEANYLCNNFTSILRPSSKVNPKYLFFALYYFHLTKKTLAYQNKTTGIINLQLDRYINTEKIPLPSLDEQLHIVDTLNQADSLRQKRKLATDLFDEYIKSVFVEMFGDSVINTKNWPLMKFKEVGTLDRGKSKHRPRNAPELLGGKYPLIQTGDVSNSEGYIKRYTQTYSEIGLKQSKMWPVGTLCITIAANIAKTGILTFEACFPDSVVGFSPNDKVRTEYIQSWLGFLQKILEDNAPEAAQKNINLEILRNLDIPVPPIEMQDKFAKIIQETVNLKQKMHEQSKELDNQFQALMQCYFSKNN